MNLKRHVLLPALAATLFFWLFTAVTRYPFAVDDYVFAWRSKLPDFSIRDFTYILPERPLATLLNYLTFKSGILEHTKLPVLLYYFLHSIGVLLIFYRVASVVLGKTLAYDRATLLIGTLICLYPDWYEISLILIDLPNGLGIIFLGLALWTERAGLRALLYFLSFCCFEAYVFPALAITALEAHIQGVLRKRAVPLFLPIFCAGVGYLALSVGLSRGLDIPKHYGIGFSFENALHMARTYIEMMAYHSFYKINWVATALDLATMAFVTIAVIRTDRSWGRKTGLLFLLPCLGAAHMLVVVAYYAPRAIHGAMVLRAVSSGILLLAFLRLHPRMKPALRWAPAALVFLAFACHHALIAFNRSHNERILAAKETEIENTLKSCSEPCHVSLKGIEDQLYWDWIMRPVFHMPFVMWIKERSHIQKQVTVD